MAKKPATAKERKHLGRVAEIGCLIHSDRPAEVHHIREGQGTSMRASHYLTIPLCVDCHRGAFSIHNSKREFESIYGSELDLLAQTIERIG